MLPTPLSRPCFLCERKAGKHQLAAIAIENNAHPDCIGNPAQVGGICRKLSGKYPGYCSLPDAGLLADLLLGYAALLCDFGKARGYEARVVHASQSCSIGFWLKFSADFIGFPPPSKKTKVSSAHPPAGQLATKWPMLAETFAR